MWICLNDGFYSVVEDRDDHGYVWVRARNPRHLTNLIPDIEVQHTPNGDYYWRSRILKAELADVMAGRITGIHYDNFKSSVEDKHLKRLYTHFWLEHSDYQQEIAGEK